MEMLTYLTGKNYNDWDVVLSEAEEKYVPREASYESVSHKVNRKAPNNSGLLFAAISFAGLVSLVGLRRRK
jgi:hypothetical protein